MKRGFLGGTFDPIHNGHLHLALEMCERYALDEVIFCPAGCSPHKENTPPSASKEHRAHMVELAIMQIPQFSLCRIEVEKEGPTYTIDTLREIKENNLRDVFHLIFAQDILPKFDEWKEVEALVALAPPLVGSRSCKLSFFLPEISKQLEIAQIPLMDISGTDLRERLRKRLYCRHLIPSNVLDYIYDNKLYFMS